MNRLGFLNGKPNGTIIKYTDTCRGHAQIELTVHSNHIIKPAQFKPSQTTGTLKLNNRQVQCFCLRIGWMKILLHFWLMNLWRDLNGYTFEFDFIRLSLQSKLSHDVRCGLVSTAVIRVDVDMIQEEKKKNFRNQDWSFCFSRWVSNLACSVSTNAFLLTMVIMCGYLSYLGSSDDYTCPFSIRQQKKQQI